MRFRLFGINFVLPNPLDAYPKNQLVFVIQNYHRPVCETLLTSIAIRFCGSLSDLGDSDPTIVIYVRIPASFIFQRFRIFCNLLLKNFTQSTKKSEPRIPKPEHYLEKKPPSHQKCSLCHLFLAPVIIFGPIVTALSPLPVY